MQTRPETHAKIAIRAAKPVPEPVKGVTDDLIQVAKSRGQSLAEAGQAYAARMFAKTSQLAESAEIKTIRSVKDWEVVDKMARRAAGLDTADVSVQTVIGIGNFDEGPVLEANSVITPAE
jgi:histone H3/H4